jgi:hypothetical protein
VDIYPLKLQLKFSAWSADLILDEANFSEITGCDWDETAKRERERDTVTVMSHSVLLLLLVIRHILEETFWLFACQFLLKLPSLLIQSMIDTQCGCTPFSLQISYDKSLWPRKIFCVLCSCYLW